MFRVQPPNAAIFVEPSQSSMADPFGHDGSVTRNVTVLNGRGWMNLLSLDSSEPPPNLQKHTRSSKEALFGETVALVHLLP